ncbi:MAG TPA: hypothetical protein VMA37_10945 [Acetobacteraceae bacterium]|nr:hypothetical protein [Acetobacteraceae bacterium]
MWNICCSPVEPVVDVGCGLERLTDLDEADQWCEDGLKVGIFGERDPIRRR